MTKLTKRKDKEGFTLIELLIVVAIIGIIAAILIPNLLDALQKAKQKRTMADMRNVGEAWYSWYIDISQAAAAGSRTYEYASLAKISASDLESILSPSSTFYYIQEVPEFDGWGNNYEYRVAPDLHNVTTSAMAIFSFGADGKIFGEGGYPVEPFNATDYNQDIVWADGYFIHYPAGAKVAGS